MTIFATYTAEPKWPATAQNPNARRYKVGERWIDADVEPTAEEITAHFAPAADDLSEVDMLKSVLIEKGVLSLADVEAAPTKAEARDILFGAKR